MLGFLSHKFDFLGHIFDNNLTKKACFIIINI